MKTNRGIYLDLNESTYVYEFESLKFYFSSIVYLKKFIAQLPTYSKNEILKLNTKYKCNLNANQMLAINLYKNIEKRGFRVYYYDKELNSNYSLTAKID